MYWVPSILNQADLFKRYVAYMDARTTSLELKQKLSELFFRANVVWVNIKNIQENERLALTIVESYRKQLLLPANGRCAVAAPPIFMMSSQIGSALASLRIMQNMVRYVAPALFGNGVAMPKSLADACKKGFGTYFKDPSVVSLLQSYWVTGGAKLRAMRNVDQHYQNLMGKTFYESRNGLSRILMLLPDNPEGQSPKQFQYKEEINAISFLRESFEKLHALYDDLARLAGFDSNLHTASADLAHVGALVPGEERTLGLLIDIEGSEIENGRTTLRLDAIEVRQVVPKEGGGNIAVSSLLTNPS